MLGPLIVDLEGLRVNDAEHAILQHRNTGAVLLFARNYKDRQQLTALVKEIRDIACKPLLIMVDHEGGRIWRFVAGFTRIPAAQEFGNMYARDSQHAILQAQQAGSIIASELLECGLDLTLAPVLDLDLGRSAVIGNRAFGDNPQQVITLARAFIAGLHEKGMAAVGKHFPGHGYCTIDTHDAIGRDERPLAEIEALDLVPFAELHTMLQGIMPAHVIYPAVDNVSTGFSQRWLQDILRQQIGFTGAIISDCLSMKGLSDAKAEALGVAEALLAKAHRVLVAGCDMVILTQQTRENLLYVLDKLDWQVSKEQQARIGGLAVGAR